MDGSNYGFLGNTWTALDRTEASIWSYMSFSFTWTDNSQMAKPMTAAPIISQ